MNPNPFLRFQVAAEAAGYPALLIVSGVSLTVVVASVAVLALTLTAWAFAMAVLSLVAALAIVAGAIDAVLMDDSDGESARVPVAPTQSDKVVPFQLRSSADAHQSEKKAA
jgi:hypothetical protein